MLCGPPLAAFCSLRLQSARLHCYSKMSVESLPHAFTQATMVIGNQHSANRLSLTTNRKTPGLSVHGVLGVRSQEGVDLAKQTEKLSERFLILVCFLSNWKLLVNTP